jgi:hypothetical protein
MKKDWAMLAGWAAGVFAAGTVGVVLIFLQVKGGTVPARTFGWIIGSLVLAAAPGCLVLGGGMSIWLKRRFQGGATRGSTLTLGLLAGSVLGLPSLLIFPLLLMGPRVLPDLMDPSRTESLYGMFVGAFSGAATGFTCAWRVTR